MPASTGKIITLLLLWGIVSCAFAQEAEPPIAVNRGYIAYNDIPEAKKGTVVFEAASGPCEKDSFPQPRKDVLPKPRKNSFPKPKKDYMADLYSKARVYRSKGLEFQSGGDIDSAMSSYRRAIALDPAYAVAYNDLGVIYEAKGLPDLAEENYLAAISIDPYCLSAYSNLALLYEQKNQLDNAAFYWTRRLELGCTGDPWVEKAKEHLQNLRSTGQVAVDAPHADSAADSDASSEQRILGLVEQALQEAEELK